MKDNQKHEIEKLRARVRELEHQLARFQNTPALDRGEGSLQAQIHEERERLLETLGDQVDQAEIDVMRAEERASALEAVIDAMVDPVLILDENGQPLFLMRQPLMPSAQTR